jgi:2-polyprenyl-6-methoxyphenol hydroxylase-like FAD-dependent oxidoreductase
MPSRCIVVMGAGVAGLSAALLLARDGHRVTVLERDGFDVGSSEDATRWRRQGIPHFLQPHALIPRARVELMRNLPDVYATLVEAGARDVDLRRKLPGAPGPQDEDLQYLAVRRPLIEWALRRAVGREALIEVRAAAQLTGLQVEGGRVLGVRVGGTAVSADLVVDALGRRTPSGQWLAEDSVASAHVETSDCGVIYYSRYYQVRPGCELPDGPWLLSPRGDLGYFGFATFPGDNGTFAALLAVPTGVPAWRAFKDADVFDAAVAQIPALRAWVDPDLVDPITAVMAMAGLRNTLRDPDSATVGGLAPVGDAYSHSDPVLAHGLAFALVHADALASGLREHVDPGDALASYLAATGPALRERYELATALDDQRRRLWLGEPMDVAHRDGDYALFSMTAAGAAATQDAEIFRAFVRRIGLLDSTQVLDRDINLQCRIEDLFAQIRTVSRPASGPSREDMLALATAGTSRI